MKKKFYVRNYINPEEDVPLIRGLSRHGVPVDEIAKKFEVSPFTIYRVLRGETYKHIKGVAE